MSDVFAAPPVPETLEEALALDEKLDTDKERLTERLRTEKHAINDFQRDVLRPRIAELRARPAREGDVTVTPSTGG